jgi:hypothetical protein
LVCVRDKQEFCRAALILARGDEAVLRLSDGGDREPSVRDVQADADKLAGFLVPD